MRFDISVDTEAAFYPPLAQNALLMVRALYCDTILSQYSTRTILIGCTPSLPYNILPIALNPRLYAYNVT